ncbi:MAG: abortive infection protein [Bacteroidia bacterium]|nr:abortive infection protein [Bacteroidia bacterium]
MNLLPGKDQVTRRQLLKQAGLSMAGIALPWLLPSASEKDYADAAGDNIQYRGVCYDTGTNFDPDKLSVDWLTAHMEYDIRIIRDELHCNAVTVFGTDSKRLIETTRFALENGLQVWIQPRLFHSRQQEMLQHLTAVAAEAEKLRQRFPRKIVLNTGCESSLFVAGMIPGDDFAARISQLTTNWQSIPDFNKKLNVFLQSVSRKARDVFKGQITYAAGPWEDVDWELFDIVGLDYYRDETNMKEYSNGLQAFKKHKKPVVVTEFGCCTYKGAEKLGAGGHDVIDWQAQGPVIKPGYARDEQVQADYLTALYEIYRQVKIDGAFVYVFHNPSLPHATDTRYDLDMGSYSLVKSFPGITTQTDAARRWERKAAFKAVAAMFGT